MKEGMSSFDIAAMVKELQSLIGARIDKVYQLDRDRLLFRLRVFEEGRKDLLIVVGKWLYLASQTQEIPKEPTSFAMLLRKHLGNGTITKIEQKGFDRIIVFHVQKAENYLLIFELFQEGNIVLVQDSKIIQPLIPKSWSHRKVRAHRDYVFPPARLDFKEIDKDGYNDILKSSKKDIVRTLAIDINLGGQYAEELSLLSGLDKGKKTNQLSDDEIIRTYEELKKLLASLDDAKGGYIVYEDSQPIDMTPFPLKIYEGYKSEKFDSLSIATEKFLESAEKKEPLDVEYEELVAKYKRQLAQQEKAVKNLKERAEEQKNKADLIYVYYQECEKVINLLKTGIKEKDIAELTSLLKEETSFKKLKPEKNEVILSLKDKNDESKEIILNFKSSVEENAGFYYDKAKKSREKLDGAKKSIIETRKQLDRIGIAKKEQKRKVKRKTKEFWFEKYRWFISSDGNIVIAGRDAKTNDKIVKKYLTEKDRYAHAEIHGAPSVVIKNKNGEVMEQTLKEACEFALAYSKAWNAKIGAGKAYWVLPDQVSKTPPSGEFLPRGSFMIRGRKNFVTNIELRLGIGKIEYETSQKVMCAPVSAIESQSKSYIIFEPGDMKKSSFIRRACEILNVEHEEVQRILPPGDIKIVRTVGIPENMI